jgi:hypothetical protein
VLRWCRIFKSHWCQIFTKCKKTLVDSIQGVFKYWNDEYFLLRWSRNCKVADKTTPEIFHTKTDGANHFGEKPMNLKHAELKISRKWRPCALVIFKSGWKFLLVIRSGSFWMFTWYLPHTDCSQFISEQRLAYYTLKAHQRKNRLSRALCNNHSMKWNSCEKKNRTI